MSQQNDGDKIEQNITYMSGGTVIGKQVNYQGEPPLEPLTNCLICNAEKTNNIICGHCNSPYLPSRLGDIFKLTPSQLQKYLSVYQPRVNRTTPEPDELMVVGLVLLMLRSFDAASSTLERVVQIQPTNAYANYALTLAGLRGRRPRLLIREEALQAEERALRALNNDLRQAHIALLLALVKNDYFEYHGFQINNPNIGTCINIAITGNLSKVELMVLLSFAPVVGTSLSDALQNLIT